MRSLRLHGVSHSLILLLLIIFLGAITLTSQDPSFSSSNNDDDNNNSQKNFPNCALNDADYEACLAQNNLDLKSNDASSQGRSNIFENDEDSDYKEIKDTPFCPIGMQGFTLRFNDDISLSLLQADSAVCEIGVDDTGMLLWGASVTLSQWLIRYHPEIVRDKTVMELGCGGAVPSMVSYHLGASRVLSTDFRQATLDHVRYHADQNKCSLDVELVDWEDAERIPSLRPDVILAADVIYGVALVPPLVKTIEKYLSPDGILVIATRDGRGGISEFRQLMKETFVEVVSGSYNETYLPEMPKELFNVELSRGRWIGNHSIYTYRRRKPLSKLVSQ
jgi:predicted nicotinamide N-methyase